MTGLRLADDVLHRIARARERMHDESDRLLRVSELARQACLSER